MKQPCLSRDFWVTWSASTASNLGDGVRLVALPLLAVTLTDDPVAIAAITALTFLPWLVVGPIAGAIVDRMDKRILMVGVQAARGVVAGLFAVTVATGTVSLWMVYAATVAIAIGETFADSAAQTAVPQLVTETQLERANGRLVGAQIVTNDIAGAPLGAALFALAAASPFVLDASSYLLAAALLFIVRTDLSPAPYATTDTPRLRDEVIEGLQFVLRHNVLRPLTMAAALTNLGAGATGGILVLFVIELLGLSDVAFGALLAVGAVGGVVGATLSARLARLVGRRRALVLTSATAALAAGGMAGAVGPVSAAWTLTVLFGATAAFNVVSQSVRQTVSPPRMLGRAITSVRLIGLGAVPIGAMAGGFIARTAGLRAPFVFAALSSLVAALVLARNLTALDHDSS